MAKRRIGPFELEKKLGVGGMGIVYLATYLKTGQSCALKVLSPAMSGNQNLLARFSREMEILKRLQHENIVRYFGGGKYKNQHYYAMELMEGGAVEDLIKQKKQLSWEQTIDIAQQVARGLEYSHNAGIVHRDLKPANLFVSKNNTVKLGDFGIARDTEATALTAAGKTVGTFAYMAPEQIAGKPPISRKTDLYALGVVMYEMLTGSPPFEAESPAELLFQHLQNAPPRVSSKAIECPVWLEQIIEKLLEKDPEDRYFDALALQVALDEVGSKVSQQQSLAANTLQGGAGGTTVGDAAGLREALGKKKKRKKKKKKAPLYENAWFLGACLALLIGLLGYALWPLSEEQLRDRWKPLMASEEWADWDRARSRYLKPYLEKFPAGEYAAEAQNHLDNIDMDRAERQAANRELLGRVPETEAERLYMEARSFEKFGDRVTAFEKYVSMVDVLKDRTEDQEKSRPYINLARRQIKSIGEAGADSNSRIRIIISTLLKADQYLEKGQKLEAYKLYDGIINLYDNNQEFESKVDYARKRRAGLDVEPLNTDELDALKQSEQSERPSIPKPNE